MSDDLGSCTTPETWTLTSADAALLGKIVEEVLSWRSAIRDGRDLLALGAVVTTLQSVFENEYAGCGVRIGWTMRPDLMEGISADLAINDEGIILSKTEYVPTGQGSSCDHYHETVAFIGRNGNYDVFEIESWLGVVDSTKGEQARFESEIMWLQEYS